MSFPCYPAYKPSGVEWLGDVPEHWNALPLRRLIRQVRSGTSVNAIDEPASHGQAGVLKTSCVYTGEFRPEENKAILESELDRATCPVVAGTLVVSRMNTPDLVGAAGLVKNNDPYLFLPDRLWLVSFQDCDPQFMNYWCKSVSYRSQVQLACSGTSSSMQNLSQENFYSFIAPLPPTGEQSAIATFLDRETAKIDALMAEQKHLIELLQEKRQVVISNAVTKGLNPNAPMKDSGVEWLGEVPEHWRVVPLKNLVKQGTSISYGIVQPGEPLEGGIPFVQTTNMSSGDFALESLQRTTADIASNYPRSSLAGGEVLLGIRASIGAAHIAPSWLAGANLSRGVARIMPSEEILNSLLLLCLRSEATLKYWQLAKQGSTFNEVSIDTVKNLKVCVPPHDEQVAISAYANEESNRYGILLAQSKGLIALLQERRSALISAAVTGQIDVRGLVPEAVEQ